MNCKRCGTELKNDDEFCYRCGQRTTVFQRMFASRAFYGSLAAILVVAAVAVLAWFIWTGRLSLPIGGGSGAAGAPQGENTAAAPEKTEAPRDRTAEPTATPYVFRPSEVTEEMRGELRPLMKKVRPFLAFAASYYENGSHTFRWGDGAATVMALYNLYEVEGAVKYGDTRSKIRREVKKEMKRLFAENYEYSLTYGDSFPDYVYRPVNDTLVYNASRITGKTYSMTVKKITEYEEGSYRINVSAGLVSESNKADKGYFQGYTLYVDRDEDAEYGYVVKKVKKAK